METDFYNKKKLMTYKCTESEEKKDDLENMFLPQEQNLV
jgi:hypothetical protein